MLVLPVHPGEVTTITTPTGDIISILLTEHRSSKDEPLLGISAPETYTIIRDRIRQKMLAELEQLAVYKVSSLQNRDEIILVQEANEAVDLYRRRYPDSSDIHIFRINTVTEQRWFSRLEKCWLLRMKPPFIVEIDG